MAEIKMDLSKLTVLSESVLSVETQIESDMQELDALVKKASDIWKTKAFQNYLGKYKTLRITSNDYEDSLINFAKFIQSSVELMDKIDETLVNKLADATKPMVNDISEWK